MNPQQVITSQYLAALEMLEQAIVKCPESLWYESSPRNKFWHIAYHAIFYTHLYIHPTLNDFSAWSKHRENYESMGPLPWSPQTEVKIGEPYSKDDVLEYLDFCRLRVQEQTPLLDLDGPSGFDWLPMNKLELQFYTIRHLQQHTGELCERLDRAGDIEVSWVGMRPVAV